MNEESDVSRASAVLPKKDAISSLPSNQSTLADVKQLGLWAAIASLSYVFWVCGGMEMIERLAFYGVRAVATLYATRPASTGNPRRSANSRSTPASSNSDKLKPCAGNTRFNPVGYTGRGGR